MKHSAMDYVQIFEDTLRKGRELKKHDAEEAVYFDKNAMDCLTKGHPDGRTNARATVITVSGDDSFQAARKLKEKDPSDDVLVLNFANGTSRGGGVRRGALAQEEDLCRTSTLYFSLASTNATAFYQYNMDNNLHIAGSDTAIYSPRVYIIKNKEYQDISPVEVSVITMAAPINMGDIDTVSIMEERIFKMLCLAEETGKKRLVLGAWGCGAFGNDPLMVAELFKINLDKFCSFNEVVFAVLQSRESDSINYRCFHEVFD